ncbi:MAG: hypothetical protein OQK97_10300 [Deltaproteobacteria bacterium]|nr:hypothetical protein [Deltaproteobacteria bacterium]
MLKSRLISDYIAAQLHADGVRSKVAAGWIPKGDECTTTADRPEWQAHPGDQQAGT